MLNTVAKVIHSRDEDNSKSYKWCYVVDGDAALLRRYLQMVGQSNHVSRHSNDVANAFVTWLRHASHHLKVVL